MADKRLLIVGVGNPDRGDDGAGPAVIAALRERLGVRTQADHLALIEHDGEATSLLEVMQDFKRVVIVDAADFGGKPGGHRRFEAGEAALPGDLINMSSHGFGVPQAIELGRALDTLPKTCSVYAIQAATFETGAPLSPCVAVAVETVTSEIFAHTVTVIAREPSHA